MNYFKFANLLIVSAMLVGCDSPPSETESKSGFVVSDLLDCPSDTLVPWNNCFGPKIYQNGMKYVGQWKDGQWSGQGTLTPKDGSEYVGEFKDGKINGQGTFVLSDLAVLEGIFKDGMLSGQGTLTTEDGSKYVGEWRDNERTGQGTYAFVDGTIIEGIWKGGLLIQGSYTEPNGAKYVGEWKDSERNGQGTFTDEYGTITKGIWKDNLLQSAKTPNKPILIIKTPENVGGATILGLEIGQSKPNNCRPKHTQFSRNFGLDQFKVYSCSVNIDGERIDLVLNGINSPGEIIEIKRRQLFMNLDAYDVKDKAFKHYDNGDHKTFEAFYYNEYTFEYKNSYPSNLSLKVGQCKDPNLGGDWRYNCVTYIQYTAKANNLGEIYDGLVAASKNKQKF
jgi:hypothetical protein